MVGQIHVYPTKLQLNKTNSDTEASFLNLDLSITNGIVSPKIYDERGDFNFEIVNFLFLGGDVPRSPSYGVYILQHIRFARVCSNVDEFNNRNLFLTAKLSKQSYRYHKGALSWYGKLTWESAHAWNLIILCLLIVWGMTFIFMVHLSFYAIPMLIYDVMYNITTIP